MIANQFVLVDGQKRNQTMITFDNGARWHKIAAPSGALQCTLVRYVHT